MSMQEPQVNFNNDEVSLKELLSVLWKGKVTIIGFLVIFAIASVAYSLSLPNIYRADALLAPSEMSSASGFGNASGQLGSIAALAGVNLGAAESSQSGLAVQVIQSRNFVNMFITKHGLLVPLMASTGWNLGDNELVIDPEVYDIQSQTWLRPADGMRGAEPTAQEAYEVFIKRVLSVSLNEDTGLYNLSVSHFSPFIAKQWVDWLIEDINDVMRDRAISDATNNLNYLHAQLEKTSISEMQTTFYSLIEEQTKSLMLAQAQDEFVFKVVDPAVAPELKSGPKRAIMCVLGTLLGGMLGVAIVLIRLSFFKKNKSIES
ncbi:TPA: Wzz/FepE/Etk N-terminal domain-containing protein [Vibrio alginolyticus]|uniref:Wzz/FepE/Etk N-terminal domain-containing protein n=1 Tax=Vibrio TaxID=662 RepID=UPI00063D9C8F|nr:MULTISPECIES: Wzz/FepE/Etk N-terminal domain-containing protein [Vibrio]KLI70627.1 lipopolysaccharide biosynthesis protein [Vibrio alginolyticus]MDM4740371.1 Wzz/FepE/Etk N-terminal domain-containing protein [Vibrio alginolyticus]MDM4760721.1 Wzz/FepE/Etk N-terminal domain-containing protein [Vibrio alginolyticus]MDW2102440.1 Wzz/FepE/Etk N-terminal domain-containing protein [Vibrio sp. 1580]